MRSDLSERDAISWGWLPATSARQFFRPCKGGSLHCSSASCLMIQCAYQNTVDAKPQPYLTRVLVLTDYWSLSVIPALCKYTLFHVCVVLFVCSPLQEDSHPMFSRSCGRSYVSVQNNGRTCARTSSRQANSPCPTSVSPPAEKGFGFLTTSSSCHHVRVWRPLSTCIN